MRKKIEMAVRDDLSRDKSLVVTFLLWSVGGVFGLHHFYLRRDRHAFVMWSTLGGWGMGWAADLFRLNKYVKDANEDPKYIADFVANMRRNPKPPFSINRFLAALMVSYSWGNMYLSAIPADEFAGINWKFLNWLTPISVALGVWTVGNIGRQRGGIGWCMVAALACVPLRYWVADDMTWMGVMVLSSALVFDTQSKEWRRSPPKCRTIIRRMGVLGICGCLYLSLWVGFLYFNGTVTDVNGDEVPVHEAIHHFFTSPWWMDLKQSLYDTYTYAQHNGWYEIWKQIIDLSDLQGEQNAYKVLGVTRDSSQHDITVEWRKLSRQFHPDKERDPVRRAERQERFLEIQQAYEILSNTKLRRRSKNKKSSKVEL